jgi:hypothetical protein
MSGLLCAGNVHVAVLNGDNSFAGFLDIKNTVKLSIAAGDAQRIERKSKRRDDFGKTLDAVTIPGTPKLSLEFDEGDAETVGLAMMGEVTTLSLASQTRTAVDFAVTKLDTWLDLGDRFINPAGFAIHENGAGALLTNGVDYVLEPIMGLVKFLSSGSVLVDDVVEKTYTTKAVAGKRIQGGRRSSLRLKVSMNGKNLADGLPVLVDVPLADMSSSSDVDVLSGQYAISALEGTIIGDFSFDYLDEAL